MKKQHIPYGLYEKYFKRPLDFLAALVVIVVFCWLYMILAILVRINLGAPVLFIQERPGKDEKIFRLYKFRTMTDARDENGRLLANEKRMTGFGKWLRATSLDELPQAFNILKGDMSLVGPRPLLASYLPKYSQKQHRRHEVRPGLTGWAQVNGRNNISWEDKFAYDVWYVDHISFGLDVKIVFKTIQKVFITHEGINNNSGATVEEFTGTDIEK